MYNCPQRYANKYVPFDFQSYVASLNGQRYVTVSKDIDW